MVSMTIRSDRNEDTMRPMRGITQREEHLDIPFDSSKVKFSKKNSEILSYNDNKFRNEVDFHHKVAYRFEKAYRLGKKVEDRKATLNIEIIECISEHASFIEADPMTLFYLLFFCIYFKNEELLGFLRNLIDKIEYNEKIHRLLKQIDQEGIDKIRTVGEQINQIVYHMVFYQAIDDNLRIVYS